MLGCRGLKLGFKKSMHFLLLLYMVQFSVYSSNSTIGQRMLNMKYTSAGK